MQQKLVQQIYNYLQQETWAFENKGKNPKLKNMYILCIYWEYLLCPQSNTSGSFLQKCFNVVEQRFTCSHFEGSIIKIYNERKKPFSKYFLW